MAAVNLGSQTCCERVYVISESLQPDSLKLGSFIHSKVPCLIQSLVTMDVQLTQS